MKLGISWSWHKNRMIVPLLWKYKYSARIVKVLKYFCSYFSECFFVTLTASPLLSPSHTSTHIQHTLSYFGEVCFFAQIIYPCALITVIIIKIPNEQILVSGNWNVGNLDVYIKHSTDTHKIYLEFSGVYLKTNKKNLSSAFWVVTWSVWK